MFSVILRSLVHPIRTIRLETQKIALEETLVEYACKHYQYQSFESIAILWSALNGKTVGVTKDELEMILEKLYKIKHDD